MVHGQYAVELAVCSAAEEPVGRIWPECLDAFPHEFVDGGDDAILLLCSYQAAVASVRVECQHGDARVGNAEVALQAFVEYGGLLHDGILGYRPGHVFQRQVCRYERHPHAAVHQYHEGLAAFANAVFYVFRVAAELEQLALYVLLVYRRGDEHVVQVSPVVGHGPVEGLESCLAGLFRRLARFHLHFFLERGQQVEPSVAGIFSLVYDAEVCLQVEHLPVVCRHLW